ncbi:tetratricopeptide repeat protein [Ulvibacter sp. MAR_2010_11]|uniref:tetratricopeptide repeat protein n=1 Tax=Ulvibacter sp. MAR_2010_11 TaxID=1250229 RepID=UPI000C2CD9EB|nr:tetratricopeptide repeat protein [Ulvibacter sp. MAR_2010_11]PKA82812.1 tetratricopeptide repeat protein [Ulvibacter sp. MAR_2010_11]
MFSIKYLGIFLLIFLQTSEGIQRCDSLILSGVDAMLAKDHARSLELLTEARTMAVNNNWNSQLFLATNNIGANYYSMLDYGEALDYYLEAYTIALKELDVSHEMTVLNNIAILYSKERNFEKAEEYFLKAYDLAKENSLTDKKAIYAVNLGLVFNEKGDYLKANSYLNEALSLSGELPQVIMQAKVALADNYEKRGMHAEAKSLAESLLTQIDDSKYLEERLSLLLNLSAIYRKQGDFEAAISYAQSALSAELSWEQKIVLYERLANLFETTKDYENAIKAKDSVIYAKEQFYELKNGRLFESNKVKFEVQNYQNQLRQNQMELEEERKKVYTISGIALLIIVLIAWSLRNLYIKNKQRKILHRRSEEIMALELEKEKHENLILDKQLKENEALALLEKERFKNEIEQRNRKLTSKALYLAERNELIKIILDDLVKFQNNQTAQSLSVPIKKLKELLKTDVEWEKFIAHFEEVNQGVLSALKERHPDLNANDIRFISYVFMNLTNKEIASMLNITLEACRKRKERIAKKMDLEDSASLYHYLFTA